MDVADLQTWRDIIIIAAGVLIALAFLAIFIFTVVLGIAGRATLGTVRGAINSDVRPLLNNVNQTVVTVRGTVSFISETAVTPIVRIYGIVAGTRRAVAVITGIVGRQNRRRN